MNVLSKKEYKLSDWNALNLGESKVLGHELLRTILLPDLLGKESQTILYFMGKNLARKFPCKSKEAFIGLFYHLGFGTLKIVKEKKNSFQFQLTGDLIEKRLSYPEPYEYWLESGCLAEQLSQITKQECECIYEINKRNKTIIFDVSF